MWTKRDDFQKCVSIVKRQTPQEDEWRKITYMVYDAPQIKKKFSLRLKVLQKELHDKRSDDAKKHVHFLEQEPVKDFKHLDEEMEKVLAKGGEGLMLKDPSSFYEQRRSDSLLKVKKFDDAEAIVLGHERGTGRCADMLGALRVRHCVTKVLFKVGTGFDDKQRKKPPKIGSKITFKHQGVSKDNIPRFPVFLREHPGV